MRYSFGRFFISFYRVNNILLLGLREAQLIALIVLVAVVPAALLLHRRALRLHETTEARGGRSLSHKP